jgi:hypothetical protein
MVSTRLPFPGLRRCLRLGLVLALAAESAFAQAPHGLETTLKGMLSAVQSGSVADFVAPGDPGFKAGMTQSMLEGVRAQLGPRLAQGYTDTFLGTLKQEGYTVYLWKLEFKDGKDDRLVTMAVREGRVAGFSLR